MELRGHIARSLQIPDVAGFVIGTRPDCISDALFDLLKEYSTKTYVALEYGVQSFDEQQLIWMRRGHTAARSIAAIKKTRTMLPDMQLGIHLILGLPGETDQDIITAAQTCNALPIDDVKLHNLHVLKNTPLADEFTAGTFTPLTLDAYAERVCLFLQHLRPNLYVHRLAALSSRPEELVAPKWTTKKMESYQFILDRLRERSAFQGQKYEA
jgi:radical SAM protein (TIGR01212 family)